MSTICDCYDKNGFSYCTIDEVLQKYSYDGNAIIPILQEIQENLGYVPKDSIEYIGEKLSVPPARIYGVVTFYTQFRLKPRGKHSVMLCVGTACHVGGAEKISISITEELGIEGGETTDDGLVTFEKVACIGCCSLAPVAIVDGETYAKLTPDKTRKIISKIKNSK